MTRFFSAVIAGALLMTSLGCGGSGGSGGGSTPQATFDSFKSAMQAKDYQKGFGQITSESQDLMIGMMSLVMSMAAAFDQEKGGEAQTILEKHGIKAPGPAAALDPNSDPKAAMSELTAGVKDKPACLAEIIAWLEKSGANKDNPNQMAELGAAELVDVKVEGDTASGKIKLKKNGADTEQPAAFKKVGDVWLIDFTKTMENPKGGLGAPPIP
jgi:hypothetical protein